MQKNLGFSFLELMLALVLLSLLIIGWVSALDWILKLTYTQEVAFSQMQEILLADSEIRYQLRGGDKSFCEPLKDRPVKIFESTRISFQTALILKKDSKVLEVKSCRKKEGVYNLFSTYFFIAKNSTDSFYSLYEKLEDQNAFRVASHIQKLSADVMDQNSIFRKNSIPTEGKAIIKWIKIELEVTAPFSNSKIYFPSVWSIDEKT